jgi:hypothetical protein
VLREINDVKRHSGEWRNTVIAIVLLVPSEWLDQEIYYNHMGRWVRGKIQK